MTQALVPCTRCARHVRATSASCPFCGTEVDASLAARAQSASSRALPRMGRAAVVAFGASVALVACGGSSAASEGGDQATESHITAGDESGNSGGHGEDPNASHDPEGSDGVHPDAASQPHPDDAGAPVAAYGAPAPDGPTPK